MFLSLFSEYNFLNMEYNNFEFKESVLEKGLVKIFIPDKGYGFIIDSETKESVFVHINNVLE